MLLAARQFFLSLNWTRSSLNWEKLDLNFPVPVQLGNGYCVRAKKRKKKLDSSLKTGIQFKLKTGFPKKLDPSFKNWILDFQFNWIPV